MKKLALTSLALIACAMFAYSQGTITMNTTAAVVYTNGIVLGSPGGPTGSYYYEVLVMPEDVWNGLSSAQQSAAANLAFNPLGINFWFDSGVSGVNSVLHHGGIISATSATVDGWPAPSGATYSSGEVDYYVVVGWSANLGTSWSAIVSGFESGTNSASGWFGETAVAYNYAGGGSAGLAAVSVWANSQFTGLPGSGGLPASDALLLSPFSFQAGPTNIFITSEPISTNANAGDNANFNVYADGFFLMYQWQFDGTNIADATNSTLNLSDVQLSSAGNYDVIITNYLGSVTSSIAVLSVGPEGSPIIFVNGSLAAVTASANNSAVISLTPGFTNGFIFYTLDGSTPDDSSIFYTGSFTLTNSAIIRAVCYSSDFSETAEMQPLALQIIPVYSLNTSVVGGGTISVNSYTNSFPSNSVVTLTAIANQYWAFDQWEGDITNYNNSIILIIDTNVNIQAVFAPTAYPMTLTTAGGGTVLANGQAANDAYFPTNSAVSLAATTDPGWTFMGWQGDVTNAANPYDLTMSQAYNIQGIFGTSVLTNAVGGGQIVLNTTNLIAYGSNVTASAQANNGKYLVTWGEAASGTNSPTVVTVSNANPIVSALFATLPANKLSLSIVVLGNGSVSISPQQSYYNPGDIVTLTATPNNPMVYFYGWTGNDNDTNTTSIVTITTNLVIQANFVSIPPSPEPPSIINQPQDTVVNAYGPASFSLTAVGTLPLSFQWSLNGSNILNATSSTLTIAHVQQSDLGAYDVLITNAYGSVTSSVANLYMYPYIEAPFTGVDTYWGQTNTLSVGAWGSGVLTYQWYQNGVAVPDATNSTLILSAIQFTNAGLYSVVISSSLGSVTNTPYQVIVNAADVSLKICPDVVIQGTVGYSYIIESTTNLSDPSSWIIETNLTLTQPIENWNDNNTDINSKPYKYYQVLPGQ